MGNMKNTIGSVGLVGLGLGYRCLTELTEVPGQSINSYRTHRSSGYCGTDVHNPRKFQAGIQMMYRYPGYCGSVAQNLQKFRVRE